jgi:hypothetical protein
VPRKSPHFEDGSKYPVFSPNGSHGPFVFAAVLQEPGRPPEVFIADGQLDIWRLLNVLYPLSLCIRRPDVEAIVIQNKPDRDLVGLACLSAIMSEPSGLFSGYPPQSRKFGGFHAAWILALDGQ